MDSTLGVFKCLIKTVWSFFSGYQHPFYDAKCVAES